MKEFILKIRDKIALDFFPRALFFVLRTKPAPKTMVIIKLDAIGDYALFRNFIEAIKKSEKFKDFKITLCGNVAYKDLAEFFDKEFVADFIWIDKKKLRNPINALEIYYSLWKRHFEIAINPSYTRDVLSDLATRATGAEERIGQIGGLPNMQARQKIITDRYYTKLIETGQNTIFEFYRNKILVEKIIGQNLADAKFGIAKNKLASVKALSAEGRNFAVLFPGASHENRRWQTEKFALVADYLADKYGLEIFVCGSAGDRKYFEEIRDKAKVLVIDMTGKNLPEFAKILSLSKIIITNDTAAAHIGAAVGAKVVSLLNGRHFGRFSPYPKEICPSFETVYPPKMPAENQANRKFLEERYKNKTDVSIKDIEPETIFRKADLLLQI